MSDDKKTESTEAPVEAVPTQTKLKLRFGSTTKPADPNDPNAKPFASTPLDGAQEK